MAFKISSVFSIKEEIWQEASQDFQDTIRIVGVPEYLKMLKMTILKEHANDHDREIAINAIINGIIIGRIIEAKSKLVLYNENDMSEMHGISVHLENFARQNSVDHQEKRSFSRDDQKRKSVSDMGGR